ncbi:MAG TPA: DUF1028 domain-containing protein [Gammaproteobacteria bacterium]
MRRTLLALVMLFMTLPVLAADFDAIRRPVATYSIVARDPATGQLGVAVQSHWFSVGQVVPWAEAGVGAVATQSFTDPNYGPLGLELMRAGRSAPEALKALVSTDENASVRQVAMIDAEGRVEAFTGEDAIIHAGHVVGENFSAQANMMADAGVPQAMAKAFRESGGDLAAKLVAALEAAQRAGGDVRGKQSAALLVVSGEPTGIAWQDRLFDLRVEDHATPVAELKRLVTLQRAYHKLNEGDVHVADGDIDKALQAYSAAMELVPDSATDGEAPFWVGVSLASVGRVDEALPYLQRAYAENPQWLELLERLPEAKLLPDDEGLMSRLRKGMAGG